MGTIRASFDVDFHAEYDVRNDESRTAQMILFYHYLFSDNIIHVALARMKRAHSGLEILRWRMDTNVRLALFVPMDNVRRTVQPGVRSVYYCPLKTADTSSAVAMIIEGLVFSLYALVGETLTDDELHGTFLYSYLFSEMIDKDNKRFADTAYGQALTLAMARQDPSLLTIVTVPSGTLEPVHYEPYVTDKIKTRLVRIETRSHSLFGYLLKRYGRDDTLTRNKNDPKKMRTHALLLMCMTRGASRLPKNGKSTVVPRHKMQMIPSLHLAREYTPLELLLGQLRISIDDFVRLHAYEHKKIVSRIEEQTARLVKVDYESMDNTVGVYKHDNTAGFIMGTNQLHASAPLDVISECAGALFPGAFPLAHELDGNNNVHHVHKAFGAKPWFIESVVPFWDCYRLVNYQNLNFQRTINGKGCTLDSVARPIMFKTHEDIMREYVPPPPKPSPLPTKPGKCTNRKKTSVMRLIGAPLTSTMRKTSVIDINMVDVLLRISLNHVKTEQ